MLTNEQAALIKGMLARGDKQHDVAALHGVNAGRIAEIATGRTFFDVKAAPPGMLPPVSSGPRFIDPRSPVEQQRTQLDALIRQPPENSRVIVITPELAASILNDLNSNNRKRRPAKIRRFADAMKADKFMLTGDTIKFGRSGVLLDGQNRLSSCVRSGVAFKTHVVFGIDDRAFSVIDINAVRNNPDTFQIAGITYPHVAAQAVRWLMISETDPSNRSRSIENEELLEFYKNEMKIDQSRLAVAVSRAVSVGRVIPAGALAAHLYLFSQVHEKAAARFADDLAQHSGGARKLIEKLHKLRKQNVGRINEVQINALIIQAWTAYRKGEALTMKMLNWTETKDYPAIV